MVAENAKQLSKRAAASVQEIKNHLYNWLNSRPIMTGEDGRIVQEIKKMIGNIQANTLSDLRMSVLSIGQYAAGSGIEAGRQIGNELSNFLRTNKDINQKDTTPVGLTGKRQRQVRRDPEVLKLQKEFNRLYKGRYAPIAEDGIMGPQTEAAKLIMHRQERLEQERPVTSPIQGLENAQKVDIGQMDIQRLTPQLYSMVLQNYKLTPTQLGRDNILDLSRTLRTYVERATKEIYNSGANYKDQASRDKSIMNMAFSMFTKEVPREALLSK